MRTVFFGTDGRLNRAAFWKRHLLLLAMWLGAWVVCGLLAILLPANTDTTGKLVLMIALLVVIFGLSVGSPCGPRLVWCLPRHQALP